MKQVDERLVTKRAYSLAARCGCRNWRYHFGLARAQLEIEQEKEHA